MLQLALAQLPEGSLNPGTLVRCDSAGATHGFLDVVVALDLSFSVGLDLTERVRASVLALAESDWVPALDSEGCEREGAWVAELTSTSRPGPRARGRSAAASVPTQGRSSPSATQVATASR